MKPKKAKEGFDTDGILFSYKEEYARFSKSRLKFKYCPQSCLLGLACTGCPVRDLCVHCNPGSALGIDHQTISKNTRGEKCFAFRPAFSFFKYPLVGERQIRDNTHEPLDGLLITRELRQCGAEPGEIPALAFQGDRTPAFLHLLQEHSA